MNNNKDGQIWEEKSYIEPKKNCLNSTNQNSNCIIQDINRKSVKSECNDIGKRKAERFIQIANNLHSNKYDYSKINYINNFTKVIIICPIHGEFQQTPQGHLKSCGCRSCGYKNRYIPRKDNLQSFIEKANIKHKNKYDYSLANYIGSGQNIEIVCKIHGKFHQTPACHISGQGCKLCGMETIRKKLSSNTIEFIKKSIQIHGNKYNYDKVNYINQRTCVEIDCKFHGTFKVSPHDHLAGHNCPLCCGTPKSTTEKFIQKSKKIHGDKYDYSLVNYSHNKSKIKIICPNHGMFLQQALIHLQNHGCPKCSRNVSNPEIEFLDYLNIKTRNVRLPEWKMKPVDGYDEQTNTIYEFLGDYWHGNPNKYNSVDINKVTNQTFKELYDNTFIMLNKLKSYGYTVNYIWESDWKKFKNKTILELPIKCV